MTLLLTLVAGSIAWPAAASGPVCTMACCAGKAPHAAGSCMHGACEISGLIDTPASGSAQHSHRHHEQQAQASDSDNDSTQILAGVTAGACGTDTDMEQVPTIEASPYQALADENTLAPTPETETNHSAFSATIISKSCETGCGGCASGFAAPNRARSTAVLASHKKALPSSSFKLGHGSRLVTYAASVCGRQSVPRGPPLSFS